MADIRNDFVGIKSPNPFWLASAPPTDKAYNVERAFKAGWGGVVWKTLGEEGPPVVNVNGPRYGAIWGADRRLLGLNKNVPLSNYRWVFRAVAIGLVVNLITGVLLFMKNATSWGTAFPFLVKMLFVVASAATILPIRTYVLNNGAGRDEVARNVRLLAIASIVAWSAAVTAGRLLAYLVT